MDELTGIQLIHARHHGGYFGAFIGGQVIRLLAVVSPTTGQPIAYLGALRKDRPAPIRLRVSSSDAHWTL